MRETSTAIRGGALALSKLAHKPAHLRLLRPSLGIKAGIGGWFFREGEVLRGVLITHRVNTARKVVIRTDRGVFNLNEEDIEDV